jgi:transcriptional regulator with XRE-family HTH domain
MVNMNSSNRQRDLIRSEEDALMAFQFAVIDALNSKGLNQSDLSELLSVSKARISQILSNNANPSIKMVGRICSTLDIPLSFSNVKSDKIKDVFQPVEYPIQGEWHYAISRSSDQRAVNDNLQKQILKRELLRESA